MKRKDPIAEARRYVENAKETLREKGELNVEMNRYEDEKYVRAAGNYLWLGVLQALDAVFHVRSDRRKKVNIDDYLNVIGNTNEKLMGLVDTGYNIMYVYMAYDGMRLKDISDAGFNIATQIIDRCETMIPKS